MNVAAKAKMCSGKIPYVHETEAIRAALEMSKKTGKGMRWYRCPLCHEFHVTSRTR